MPHAKSPVLEPAFDRHKNTCASQVKSNQSTSGSGKLAILVVTGDNEEIAIITSNWFILCAPTALPARRVHRK